MSDVKWIKIVVDIFDDEKILLIESLPERDSIIVIWFKLLCLAGKQNNGGVFMLNDRIAYTDEMLAVIFRRPVNTVRLALQTFEQFGMIEIVGDTITIPNWDRHQSLDALEKRRQYQRDLMRKRRAEQHDLTQNANSNANCDTNGNANVSILEREEEREEEILSLRDNIGTQKAAKRFVPPSVAEVRAYCQERKNNVDAETFVDYYTANGWKVGKNPMKDWKAAVRTWERKGWNGYGYSGEKKNPDRSGSQSSIDLSEAEKLINTF